MFEKNLFSTKENVIKKSVLGSYVDNHTFIRVMLKLRLKNFHDTIRDSEIGVVSHPLLFLLGNISSLGDFVCVCIGISLHI